MSLFDCMKCNGVENTAMAPWFGMENIAECSLCHEGTWHGEFERYCRIPERHAQHGADKVREATPFSNSMKDVLRTVFEAALDTAENEPIRLRELADVLHTFMDKCKADSVTKATIAKIQQHKE